MASLQEHKIIFGTGQISFYLRDNATGEASTMLCTSQAVLSAEFNTNVELVQAAPAGASRHSADAQFGKGEAMLSVTLNKLPLDLFQAIAGKALTETAAEATGFTDTALTDVTGTSMTTSITAVAKTSGAEEDLKNATYTIVALTSSTVDIYSSRQEAPIASGITISTGANVIANTGITLTGGTVSLTVGDEATFETRSINTKRHSASFTGRELSKSLVVRLAAQQTTGDTSSDTLLEINNAVCVNLPMSMSTGEYTEFELEFAVLENSFGNMYTFTNISV